MAFREDRIGDCRLILGDCREVLQALPAESVHCCVTSPPYFGLRDYGVDGQIGLETTPAAYIANLVEIMRGVRRVLRSDGTLWLVIADSYAGASIAGPARSGEYVGVGGKAKPNVRNRNGLGAVPGIKPKDLIGIPWMLAFALRDNGWYLRKDCIWHKPNPMPESVTDRPTSAHEYLFLLTKSARYFYDAEAIKEPSTYAGKVITLGEKSLSRGQARGRNIKASGNGLADTITVTARRNRRSVWTIATAPFRGAHFATFPPALVEPCILAGTSEYGVCGAPMCGAPWERIIEIKSDNRIPYATVGTGEKARACRNDGNGLQKVLRQDGRGGDLATTQKTTIGWHPTCSCNADAVPATVIDPFAGASTTALVAGRLGRASISIELSATYHDMACQRINAAQPQRAA